VAYWVAPRVKLSDGLPAVKEPGAPRNALGVLPQGGAAKLVLLTTQTPPEVERAFEETMALDDSLRAAPDRRTTLNHLRNTGFDFSAFGLRPAAGEATGKVVSWLSLIQASIDVHVPVVLTPDRAALEQPPTAGRPRVRLFLASVTVTGGLAKEPLVRGLRQ